jgi:hypothetical protein
LLLVSGLEGPLTEILQGPYRKGGLEVLVALKQIFHAL